MKDILNEGLSILSKYGECNRRDVSGDTHAGPQLNVSNPVTEADEDALRNLGWVIGPEDRWMLPRSSKRARDAGYTIFHLMVAICGASVMAVLLSLLFH